MDHLVIANGLLQWGRARHISRDSWSGVGSKTMFSDVAQLGTGMLAMFVNLDTEWHKEFRTWLQEDMFTARLNIGFNACASYDLIHGTNSLVASAQTFLTLYETASMGVLYSEPYQSLRRERNSKDVTFHERFLDTERYILSWVGPELAGGEPGFSPFLFLDRFDLSAENNQDFNFWFVTEYLPACDEINGLIRLRRFTTIEGGSGIFLFHEFDELSALTGEAWNSIRGNAAWDRVNHHRGGSVSYQRVIYAP